LRGSVIILGGRQFVVVVDLDAGGVKDQVREQVVEVVSLYRRVSR